MAAGDEHAVGAAGQRLEHERGIQPARTHEPDQTHVGRIFEPGSAGQVRGPVATPVAGEADDQRLKLIFVFDHDRFSLHTSSATGMKSDCHTFARRFPATSSISNPCNWARTCSLLKPVPVMAPDGQAATQVPQPWQRAGLM